MMIAVEESVTEKKKPENHSNKNAELTSKRAYVVERHSTKQAQAVVTTLNNYKAHLVKKAPDIKKKKMRMHSYQAMFTVVCTSGRSFSRTTIESMLEQT